jgi:hypothetical protein
MMGNGKSPARPGARDTHRLHSYDQHPGVKGRLKMDEGGNEDDDVVDVTGEVKKQKKEIDDVVDVTEEVNKAQQKKDEIERLHKQKSSCWSWIWTTHWYTQ